VNKIEADIQADDINATRATNKSTQEPSAPNKVLSYNRTQTAKFDKDLAQNLDNHSLESIVELKISRFLEQIGSYYPESLHATIMRKVEKPLLNQILRRTGGNQVHAARILGINRNTLRKKMKLYGFC